MARWRRPTLAVARTMYEYPDALYFSFLYLPIWHQERFDAVTATALLAILCNVTYTFSKTDRRVYYSTLESLGVLEGLVFAGFPEVLAQVRGHARAQRGPHKFLLLLSRVIRRDLSEGLLRQRGRRLLGFPLLALKFHGGLVRLQPILSDL